MENKDKTIQKQTVTKSLPIDILSIILDMYQSVLFFTTVKFERARTIAMVDVANNIQRAADLIRAADALIIMAGAGMSVDSGLPDYRYSMLPLRI